MKVGNILNFIYDKLLSIVLIIVLLVAAYFIYDIWYVKFISSGDSYLAYKPDLEDPDKYKDLSKDCIGWITIDDTSIDYPIMQGPDNSKYLNMNPHGEYSLSGSIFLDYKNNKNFTDPYSLIYGHHMEGYQMFGALDRFADRKYFDTHLTGTLTANGKQMPIKVFSFTVTDANEKIIFDPTNHTGQLNWIRNNSKYFNSIPESSRIVALSTCKDPGTTERTIVFVYIL